MTNPTDTTPPPMTGEELDVLHKEVLHCLTYRTDTDDQCDAISAFYRIASLARRALMAESQPAPPPDADDATRLAAAEQRNRELSATLDVRDDDGEPHISFPSLIDALREGGDRRLADKVEELVCYHWRRADAAEQRQRWIPVTERLPKDGNEVLIVSSEYRTVLMARKRGDWWDFDHPDCDDAPLAEMSHWMAMPHPPLTPQTTADAPANVANESEPRT